MEIDAEPRQSAGVREFVHATEIRIQLALNRRDDLRIARGCSEPPPQAARRASPDDKCEAHARRNIVDRLTALGRLEPPSERWPANRPGIPGTSAPIPYPCLHERFEPFSLCAAAGYCVLPG